MLDPLEEAVAAAAKALYDHPRLLIGMTGGRPEAARQLAARVAVEAATEAVERLLREKLRLVEQWRVSVPDTDGQGGRHTWSLSHAEDTAWSDHAQAVSEKRWGSADQVWVERHFDIPGGTPWVRVHKQSGGGRRR